ncbi:MAG: phosphoribosyltransferase [Saprospiraceae bacterium]|nr:phosphoribosyltransferase [Saprospiraceae bacterium]
MRILDDKAVKQKIQRLAFQIAENNFQYDEIILAGINNNGYGFAKLLERSLKKVIQTSITTRRIKLNPANPLDFPIEFIPTLEDVRSKVVIIVDDVANTGRTIFYAFRPLMETLPHKIEVAVLVDRKHKHFPIQVDYVGLSLATTLKENITVKILGVEEMEVHLD